MLHLSSLIVNVKLILESLLAIVFVCIGILETIGPLFGYNLLLNNLIRLLSVLISHGDLFALFRLLRLGLLIH